MKTKLFTAAACGLTLALAGVLTAAEKEFHATCPVSGAPAKEANSVDFLGKKVYFCCQNCPKKYTANPDKFALKAKQQLAATGQITQVACPISGKPAKADQSLDVGGVDVHFCCGNCKAKAEGADNVLAAIFGDLEKAFTLQTTCPVSGKALKADQMVEHDGKKVYFCCDGCPAAFEKDPSKFLSKLPQFNVPAK